MLQSPEIARIKVQLVTVTRYYRHRGRKSGADRRLHGLTRSVDLLLDELGDAMRKATDAELMAIANATRPARDVTPFFRRPGGRNAAEASNRDYEGPS